MMKNDRCRKRIKRFLCSVECPFVLFSLIIIVLYSCISTSKADDVFFSQVLRGDQANLNGWIQFLKSRWEMWSSRLAIEGMLIVVARFPIIWRVLSAAIHLALFQICVDLSNSRKNVKVNWIIFFLMFLYPLSILYEAGAIATTVNYLWPLTAGLFAMSPVIKRFFGRESRPWRYAVSIPFLIFACFQEILCAVLLMLLLCSAAYTVIAERKFPIREAVFGAVCIGVLYLILICPGNSVRFEQEVATWLPQYAELTHLYQKLELGFSSMMYYMFLRHNVFIAVFCLVTALGVQLRDSRICYRVLAWIPFAFSVVFGLLGDLLGNTVGIRPIRWLMQSVGDLGTGLSFKDPLTILPDLIFATVLVFILISLYHAIQDRKLYWFSFVLLVVGAASRMALGFSPTVWASTERTCTFLYVCMSAVLGILLFRLLASSGGSSAGAEPNGTGK